MTNILNNCPSDQFDKLEQQVTTERYEKLLDLVLDHDLQIALALCDATPVDDIDSIAQMLHNLVTPTGFIEM